MTNHIALGLAVLVALAAAFESYQLVAAQSRELADPYMVSIQATRLAGLLNELPADSIAGYVSDLDVTSPGGQAAMYSMQYTLAPRLVVPPERAPVWVIGNFSRPLDYQSFGKERSLVFLKDLGNGVVLFRKQGK